MNNPEFYPALLSEYRCFEQERAEQIKAGRHDYCLLTAVLPANDEERLHSRFIYSMINPAGLHYQGNKFLRIFLEQLPEQLRDFIKLDQAVVEREAGNIDLLINDGEHYLIIENKLNAGDQRHQITRYIKHVQERYLPKRADVSKHIAVVYLSKSRKKPSAESQSLIGFDLTDQQLAWQGLTDEKLPAKVKGINLAPGQVIPFVHMGYFPAIKSWASECMEEDIPNGITSAFNDYQAVLKRINQQGSWRNVMTLEQYALNLGEAEQKDMYAFMVEANKSLMDFVSIKLHDELKRIFRVSELAACDAPYRSITPQSLKTWLSKQPNVKSLWRDIACCTADDSMPSKALLFGVEYAYLSELSEDGKVHVSDETRVPYGKVRKILTEKDGLYKFVACVENMLAKP